MIGLEPQRKNVKHEYLLLLWVTRTDPSPSIKPIKKAVFCSNVKPTGGYKMLPFSVGNCALHFLGVILNMDSNDSNHC